MRKNQALIASFIGLVALSACGSRPKNTSTPHEFDRDMTEAGWTLLEDVGFNPVIEVSNLELVSFLEQDETYVDDDEIAIRAKNKDANLGQLHAEYLLTHQNKIPEEFREYAIVFPGTKWNDPLIGAKILCLCWYDGRWETYFRWIGNRWGLNYRLVRHSK